jgi:hypothetical protein
VPRGLLLFLAAAAIAAGTWALAVLPAQGESSRDAEVVAKAPATPGTAAPRAGLTPGESKRLAAAVAALRSGPPAAASPRGIEEREPRVFTGRLPWSEVQGFLAWAASRREPVESVEVRARAEDPDEADCRLVLAAEDRR